MDERDRKHRSVHNPTKDADISPLPGIRKTAAGTAGANSAGGEAGQRQADASAALQAADTAAGTEPDNTADAKTREAEATASDSGFKNKVSGKGGGKKSGFKALFKKYRTMLVVLGFLGLGGGGILVAQSSLGYNLVSRMLNEGNPMFITNHLRSPSHFKYAINHKKLPDEQKEILKEHGIEVIEKKGKKPKLRYIDEQGKTRTVSAKKAFKDDSFRIKYEAASKEYAGQYAGQHDPIAIKLRKRLSISLDNWHSWRNDTIGDDAKMKRAKFRNILKEKLVSKFNGGASRSKANEDDVDENENKGEVTAKDSKEKIKSTLRNVVSTAFTGVAIGKCTYFAVNTALSAYTMGLSISNSFAVASTLLEAIQKAEAGDGTEAPIHEALNSITEVDPETGTSALDDTGLGDMFSGATGKTNGDVAGNIERIFVVGERTITDFNTCATLSIAADVGSLVLSVFSGGAAGTAKRLGKALLSFGAQAGAAFAMNKIVESYIENAAEAIKREFDVSNNISGEAFGANLYNGGNEMLARTAQVSGAAYFDAKTLEEYEVVREAVLDEEAEYERATKSPFDTHSQYTFLGSLVNNSLIPLATSISNSSVGKLASQSSAVLSNSLADLLPSANAIGATHAVTTQGDCPRSNAVGAVGNRYCISYRGTDTSTISDDCDLTCVIRFIMNHYDAFEETEFTLTPTIKDNTNLARYQKYCGLRETQVGLFDGDITSQIDEENGGTDLAATISDSTILSLLPFAGDIADIVTNINRDGKSDWIDGTACVMNNKHWDEYKWYQRFLEDQRLAANMGVIEQSAGDQFITAYFEQHPVDNSREGIIARLSGLSKDDVIAIEDQIFYDSYLATEYNPTTLGPVFHDDSYETPPLNLATYTPTGGIHSAEAVTVERVVYAPLQARTSSTS